MGAAPFCIYVLMLEWLSVAWELNLETGLKSQMYGLRSARTQINLRPAFVVGKCSL